MDFVIGHPRSGTQFVAALLNAPGVEVAAHEYLVGRSRRALLEAASGYYEGRRSNDEIKMQIRECFLPWSVTDQLRRTPLARRLLGQIPDRSFLRIVSLLRKHLGAHSIQIDCNWKNTWILPPLLELFPDARFLHLVRDPRSNVLGCYNLDYYGDLSTSPRARTDAIFAHWRRTMPQIRRPDWDALSVFAKNCAFWTETHRLILEAFSSRPQRYTRVRLEDLKDPEAVTRLFHFFQLPTPPVDPIARALAVPVNAKESEKLAVTQYKKDLLPRFEDCPAEIQATLHRLCAPLAAQLGYPL